MHVINPIAFVGCYLLFCNDAERRIVSVTNFITLGLSNKSGCFDLSERWSFCREFSWIDE